MSDLPDGWAGTSLGEITSLRGEKLNPASMPDTPFVGLEDIEPNTSRILKTGTGSDMKSSVARFYAGDVLYSRLRPYLNKVTVPDFDGLASAEILVLQPTASTEAEFVRRRIMTREFLDFAALLDKGDRPRVNYLEISTFPVALPPLPEQLRIVAKVDGLTARTARARKELNRLPTLIARYKQRLLALAFSGRLIGKVPTDSDNFFLGCWSIPKNWQWVRFDEAAEVASNLVKPETIPDLPHIAPDNIQAGTGRLLSYRTIAEDKLISAKNRFYPGQVLYSKIRPYLKKAVIVDFDGACSADMYPINPGAELNARFLLYWLISDDFAQFSALHEGRTVLPKINQKALNATPFPLPPLSEQAEIVRRIESAFGWLDRMAADHAAAARLLPKLDAAILSKAFQGKLVPQDPTDEPASVLLERIQAEREATPKEKRGRKVNLPPITGNAEITLRPLTVSATGRVGNVPTKTRKVSMTKSRLDDDVRGKPYLSGLLKSSTFSDVQNLFRAANLPVADFYKQLSWEIDQGHIFDNAEDLKAA